MATRFFLRDENNSLSGSFPSSEQGGGTPTKSWSGSGTLKTLNTVKGSTQTFKGDTVASASAQRHFLGMWCSAPLAAQTISANTWTTFCTDREDNLSANYFANLVNVYVWRPSTGAKVGTIIDGSNGASQGGSEPTSASSDQVTTWTFSGSSVVIQAGDVIIVERWAVFTPAMSNTYNLRFNYDGTTETGSENAVVSSVASYVETPQNLTFASTNYTADVNETVSLSESLAVAYAAISALPETVSLSEALGAIYTGVAGLPETVSFSESLTTLATMANALPETVEIQEGTTGSMALSVDLSDPVDGPIGEVLVAGVGGVADLPETVAFSEVLVAGIAMTAGLPETVSLAESTGSLAAYTQPLAETDTLSEQIGIGQDPVNLSETVTLTESVGSGNALFGDVLEGWQFTEVIDVRTRAVLGDRQYPPSRWRKFRTKRLHS